MPLIQLKNIECYASQKLLFKANNLQIEPTDHIGLIGDNGCGKSTLLNIIAKQKNLFYHGECIGTPQIAYITQFIEPDDKPLSGGERTKQKIRHELNKNVQLLLADEPNNHLDETGITYLAKQLEQFNGAVVLVTHNRTLLNQVCNKIWEIDNGKITVFEGNYESYETQKEALKEQEALAYNNYNKEKKRLKQNMLQIQAKSNSIKRTPKRMGNSEARLHRMGGQNVKKKLDKAAKNAKTHLEQLEYAEKPYTKKTLSITLPDKLKINAQDVLYTNNLSIQLGDKTILKNATIALKTGSKTALVGKNGAGKTSLLNAIFERNAKITYAQNCKMIYLDQFNKQLCLDETILKNIEAISIYDEHTNREVLAQLLFRGESVFKTCGILSGGERSRVCIAMMILSDANVLLLDEVTNHMDLKAIKAVEEALAAYTGTILFTSHDNVFVQNIATQVWHIKKEKIEAEF